MLNIEVSNHYCKIYGILNFSTVLQLRKEGMSLIHRFNETVFDFEGVSQSDSSTIALLLNWIRHAHSLQKSIVIINLPQQLLDIATVCGVSSYLNYHNKEIPYE